MTIQTIDHDTLETRIAEESPDNDDPREGWALVSVVDDETFEAGRIPQSIHIPGDDLDNFERQFAKEKELVLYCATLDCEASRTTAEALVARGFENVYDYADGLSKWQLAGFPVATDTA